MTRPRVTFTVERTPAHRRSVLRKPNLVVGVSAMRVDLTRHLPIYKKNLRMPTFGLLRDLLQAYTLDRDRKMVTEDAAMRETLGIGPNADVLTGLLTDQGLHIWAYSGIGNHPLNAACCVWHDGELIHRVDEGQRITLGPAYFCIVIYKNGSVRAEVCHFVPGPNGWEIVIDNRSATGRVHMAISGPPLVREGRPIDPYSDLEAASEHTDFRHLACGPYPLLTDFHSGQLTTEQRDYCLVEVLSNPGKKADAIRGKIVELQPFMRDTDGREYTVTPDALVEALIDKGYTPVAGLQELESRQSRGERGLYWLDPVGTVLHIIYRRSPYPHHFLALRDDDPGALYDFAIGGWSNNGGSDPATIAANLAAAGFSFALMGDNGFDVAHYVYTASNAPDAGVYDRKRLTPALQSTAGRPRIAGLMVYASPEADWESTVTHRVAIPANQNAAREDVEIVF
jgi:hypothetical protein